MENEKTSSGEITASDDVAVLPKSPLDPSSVYSDEIRSVVAVEVRTYINLIVFALVLIAAPTILIVVNEKQLSKFCEGPFLGQENTCNSYAYIYAVFLLFLGGISGASLYALRGVTKAVELRYWTYDRLIWRRCFPIVGGVVALFMFLLNTAEIISPFNSESFHRPTFSLAYGFVVGYFADSVLQVLSRVAGDFLDKFQQKKKDSSSD